METRSLSVSMIVIGDEILNGRTTDLNASWLSRFLFKAGLTLSSVKFIRDYPEEIHQAIREGFKESDVIITSGGIGPTLDDKTKNTLAAFFGKTLQERQDVAEIVLKNYERFGRTWHPGLNHYHFFPEDFVALPNPKGLAPGIEFYEQGKKQLILSGPGVPREFFSMVEQEFIPRIKKYFPHSFKTNYQTVIRTEGVAEEKIFFELCPDLWKDLETFGKVSSLPHTIGIDIIVSYHGSDDEHKVKQEQIKKLIDSTPLKKHVWQWGNLPLNELVLAKALEKKKTFAFAESCTGGLIASKITDLPGSSRVFWGGVVAYDNSVKIKLLNVSEKSLSDKGAVSLEVAKEMAEGVLKKCSVDLAIAVSGIAGPDGGTPEKPVGTITIGFATARDSGSTLHQFPGDRLRLKERFSDMALLKLYRLLCEE